ncbi:MAG: hypothetical protein Q9213_006517 [Squamulea squamosa]
MDEAKALLKEQRLGQNPSVLTKTTQPTPFKETSEASGEQTFQPELDMPMHPTGMELTKSVLGERFHVSIYSANIARPVSKEHGTILGPKCCPPLALAEHLGNIVVLDSRFQHASGSNITMDEDRVILFA